MNIDIGTPLQICKYRADVCVLTLVATVGTSSNAGIGNCPFGSTPKKGARQGGNPSITKVDTTNPVLYATGGPALPRERTGKSPCANPKKLYHLA